MNIRKILSLFLALCMLPVLLCACGGSGDETEAPSTEPTVEIMQKSDPAEDDTLNILMIGNSF